MGSEWEEWFAKLRSCRGGGELTTCVLQTSGYVSIFWTPQCELALLTAAEEDAVLVVRTESSCCKLSTFISSTNSITYSQPLPFLIPPFFETFAPLLRLPF